MRSEESLRREGEVAELSPPVAAPRLVHLPRWQARAMVAAGGEILECYRVLRKAGLNVVGEVLRGRRGFREHEHYPKDDVHDPEHRSQYYYHAHRGFPGEHGHFHTFLRSPDGETTTHLVAISMDAYGYPIALFIPNRWVTDGDWRPAHELAELLPRFRIDHAAPSWPVNRWISAMLALFAPHVGELLAARDEALAAWRAMRPGEDALECRELDVLAQMPISVDATLAELQRVLQ